MAYSVMASWHGKRLAIGIEFTTRKYAMKAAFRAVMNGADWVCITHMMPIDEEV